MTRRTARARSVGQRGSTTIEFAMIGLTLMMLIFGMMETARAFWTYQIMNEVAIEGARCMGVVASGCSSSGAYSQSAASSYIVNLAGERGLTITGADVSLSRPTACASTAGFSQVTITYTFATAVPTLVPGLSSLALTAVACYYNVR